MDKQKIDYVIDRLSMLEDFFSSVAECGGSIRLEPPGGAGFKTFLHEIIDTLLDVAHPDFVEKKNPESIA